MSDDKIASVHTLPIEVRSLAFRDRVNYVELKVDDDTLTCTVGPVSHQTTKYDLIALLPDFSYGTVDNEGSGQMIRKGLGFVLAAVVFYFSDFRESVPLLSPVLAGLGGFALLSGLFTINRSVYTLVYEHGGGPIIKIPHSGTNADERTKFEASLARRIRTRHQNYFLHD